MEGQLKEALTYPAQLYAQSFLKKIPTDSRFLQCTHQKFMSNNTLDSTTLEFTLDRYDVGNVYLIQDTCIEVQCLITKNDGNLPAVDVKVSTVNNLLHSMFESVRLVINDLPITVSPNNYGYKAYMSDVLSYSSQIKACQLSTQGFYADLSDHMGPVDDNSGFTDRMSLFRKGFDESGAYKSDGTTLFGRLMHDLGSMSNYINLAVKI
jgi:hypothetical protein